MKKICPILSVLDTYISMDFMRQDSSSRIRECLVHLIHLINMANKSQMCYKDLPKLANVISPISRWDLGII